MVNDIEARIDRLDQVCFAEMECPAALHASLDRHRKNLLQLVRTLQSAGITEAEIEASVSVIVASYRDELVNVIKSMKR